MSHIDAGPLAGYNSLLDPHLSGYFANTRMKQHLRKSGLVTKTGHIVSESTFRLNMAKKEHKKHVRELLAQAIVHKTLDMERMRQVNIKKKLEEIAKIELVHRVRGNESDWPDMIEHLRIERPPPSPCRNNHTQTVASSSESEYSADLSHRGDEDILPLMIPKGKKRTRPSSVPLGKTRRTKRPISAPATKAHASTHLTDSESTLYYVESDGTPVAVSEDTLTRVHSKGRRKSNTVASFRSAELDDKHLYSLDQHSLREITMGELTVGGSPYLLPLCSPVPAPPSSGHPSPARGRRSRRIMHPTDSRGKSTKLRNSKGSLMLHRQEPAMKHQERVQTMCDVTMHYFGSSLRLDYERLDPRDEVIVEQQHCGGNTLFVFREKILPRSDFTFTSRRHRGFPYSLTFYINGKIDCRVSTCCEYKHPPAARLGGKMGHFGIVAIEGATPCYKCQINEAQKNREKKPQRRTKRMSHDEGEQVDVDEEIKEQEIRRSPEVELKAMVDHDHSDRTTQPDEPVIIPVEDDGSSVNPTPGRTDDYSDEEFEADEDEEGAQSSRSSSASSSSDSSVKEDFHDSANNKRPQSPALTNSPASKSQPKSLVHSDTVAESIHSDTTERSVRSERPVDKRSQTSLASIKTEASDHPADTAKTVDVVADDGNVSNSAAESVASSSEDSEFTNDRNSQVQEPPVEPEESVRGKITSVVEGESKEHHSGDEMETLKIRVSDTPDGVAELTSSSRSIQSTNSVDSKKSSTGGSGDASPMGSDAAPTGGDAAPPSGSGDSSRQSTKSYEAETTSEDEKTREQPLDQSSGGVGVTTAESTLHTEVAEEMQKVLQEQEHKASSDSEMSEDSSDDSSEDSSEEDSATEEESTGKDGTEPQWGATDTPPEGSIESLVAGKRQVLLKDMTLTSDQVDQLVRSLRQTGVIESLTLSGCQLDHSDLEKLAVVLAQTPSTDLATLELTSNRLDVTAVEHLLKIVRHKTQLDVLVLQDNPLKDDGVRKLVEGLLELNNADNKSEDSEKLRAIKSTAHDIVSSVVADVIKNEPDMSSGGSTGHSSGTSSAVLVAKLEAAGDLGLRELNLSNVEMGETGAKAVAKLIAANTNLAVLDLSGNTGVPLSSWQVIADALKTNRTITKLALNRASLTDEVVAIIANALTDNTKLTSIELAGNNIGETGGAKILEMVNMNSKISQVEVLPGNQIPDELVRQIKDCVHVNAAG